jgi:hypothetical protein
MPHENEEADIQCELFEYSLQNSDTAHLYEALSYVWGNPDVKRSVFTHEYCFNVTTNLWAALSHLRNHARERILWVDAICIDQENREEKEHQIQSMAKIYAQANRVIVWLGEGADNSNLALKAIRMAGGKRPTHHSDSGRVQSAVLALLQRPWFRRIWVREQTLDSNYKLIHRSRFFRKLLQLDMF